MKKSLGPGNGLEQSVFADNLLLAPLSAKALGRLPFEKIEMKAGEILCRSQYPIDHAYFPLSGMISLVQTLDDGGTVEVGMIGREGFFGVPLLYCSNSTPVEALVQGSGSALRLPSSRFMAEVAKNDVLRSLLLRYSGALYAQTLQTAACNGRHKVPERLARWLLEAHDRLETDDMPLRHEFISYMLGCRRSSVTVGVGALRRRGIIEIGRGVVRVKDRRKLEAAACGCYETVREEFKRLFAKPR